MVSWRDPQGLSILSVGLSAVPGILSPAEEVGALGFTSSKTLTIRTNPVWLSQVSRAMGWESGVGGGWQTRRKEKKEDFSVYAVLKIISHMAAPAAFPLHTGGNWGPSGQYAGKITGLCVAVSMATLFPTVTQLAEVLVRGWACRELGRCTFIPNSLKEKIPFAGHLQGTPYS